MRAQFWCPVYTHKLQITKANQKLPAAAPSSDDVRAANWFAIAETQNSELSLTPSHSLSLSIAATAAAMVVLHLVQSIPSLSLPWEKQKRWPLTDLPCFQWSSQAVANGGVGGWESGWNGNGKLRGCGGGAGVFHGLSWTVAATVHVSLAVLLVGDDVSGAPPLLAVRPPAPPRLRFHVVPVVQEEAPVPHHCHTSPQPNELIQSDLTFFLTQKNKKKQRIDRNRGCC